MTALSATGLSAAPRGRGRTVLAGTGFAIAASIMYFAGLFGVYLHERAGARLAGIDWIPSSAQIDLTQPTMIMWTLIISVVVMQWAVYSTARDDRPHALLAVGATLALGAMAILQYAWQFTQMGLVADESVAAVLIYTITGSHLVMVLVAMTFVALMGFRALAGQYSSRQTDGIVAASLFWYAMVSVYFFVWIGVFIAK
ncbi:MAG: cytochrome c oxidase subunit 3 [Acidimicrobiales bacterium]